MELTEYLIWFSTPIALSLFVGVLLKKTRKLPLRNFAITGIVLGIAEVLMAPTILSTSLHEKIIGSFVLAVVVNSILLFIVTLWFNSKVNNKTRITSH